MVLSYSVDQLSKLCVRHFPIYGKSHGRDFRRVTLARHAQCINQQIATGVDSLGAQGTFVEICYKFFPKEMGEKAGFVHGKHPELRPWGFVI